MSSPPPPPKKHKNNNTSNATTRQQTFGRALVELPGFGAWQDAVHALLAFHDVIQLAQVSRRAWTEFKLHVRIAPEHMWPGAVRNGWQRVTTARVEHGQPAAVRASLPCATLESLHIDLHRDGIVAHAPLPKLKTLFVSESSSVVHKSNGEALAPTVILPPTPSLTALTVWLPSRAHSLSGHWLAALPPTTPLRYLWYEVAPHAVPQSVCEAPILQRLETLRCSFPLPVNVTLPALRELDIICRAKGPRGILDAPNLTHLTFAWFEGFPVISDWFTARTLSNITSLEWTVTRDVAQLPAGAARDRVAFPQLVSLHVHFCFTQLEHDLQDWLEKCCPLQATLQELSFGEGSCSKLALRGVTPIHLPNVTRFAAPPVWFDCFELPKLRLAVVVQTTATDPEPLTWKQVTAGGAITVIAQAATPEVLPAWLTARAEGLILFRVGPIRASPNPERKHEEEEEEGWRCLRYVAFTNTAVRDECAGTFNRFAQKHKKTVAFEVIGHGLQHWARFTHCAAKIAALQAE